MSDPRNPPGYYLDNVEGDGDIFVCTRCVEKFEKSTDRPLTWDVHDIIPVGCGFHVYGGDPDNYV